MKSTHSESNLSKTPRYTIAQIMALLSLNEPAVREMIKKAGISIGEFKRDPSETICYEDFRILWISVANRREGRLLATMLIEERHNWFASVIRKRQ